MDHRLKGTILIDRVFSDGKTYFAYPIKSFMLKSEKNPSENSKYKFGVSVSKRNLKHAVDRNKIKRRMRAALSTQIDQSNVLGADFELKIMFVYVSKEVLPFNVIYQATQRVLKKAAKKQ